MKVFFDTNVYVSEALLGEHAIQAIRATVDARWKIFTCSYQLDELSRVMSQKLGLSMRWVRAVRIRVLEHSVMVTPLPSRHAVARDPNDSPILNPAIVAGVAFLVTIDRDLLTMDPYEGIRIISLWEYRRILEDRGMLPSVQ